MLHKLRIRNGIKHKDSTFEFKKGLTVIKGKNGNGKSLIQEFIRFALFGSSALRGKVADYPSDMDIELDFSIKNEEINIKRTTKDCVVKCGENTVKGTTQCNAFILSKLGYDLSVFDMGNAAKQFEIDKLGKMKPSERKNAIDQIIGLTAVTKLIKQLKDEKNEIKNYILGFKNALVEPEIPRVPENYTESSVIDGKLREKRKIKADRDLAEARMKEHECICPQWNSDVPVGDLKNESLYNYHKNAFDKLIKEFPVCGSKYTRDELTKWYFDSRAWRNWEEPGISLEEIQKQKGEPARRLPLWSVRLSRSR